MINFSSEFTIFKTILITILPWILVYFFGGTMCEACTKSEGTDSISNLKFYKTVESNSFYKASLTREQFLFFEMRTLARLIYDKGLSENEAVQSIIENNLFQYPTSRSLSRNANTCLRRLHSLGIDLAKMLVHASVTTAKQICFYAMMKQHRLVRDFAVEIMGEKYRTHDFSYSKRDLNVFFMHLQNEDSRVASWSESTVQKIKQVLNKALCESGYIANTKSNQLQKILLDMNLERAIRKNGDETLLPAFNCFRAE